MPEYDSQSPDNENHDWQEARSVSKEIIQFSQAMFESRLDAMMRDKVGRIVNAMLGCILSSRRFVMGLVTFYWTRH